MFSSNLCSTWSSSCAIIVCLCLCVCNCQNENKIRKVSPPYPLSYDLSSVSGSFMSYGPNISNVNGQFFRTLTLSDGQLFIGGKNQLFTVSPVNLTTLLTTSRSQCNVHSDNYVQVIQPLSDGILLECGICREPYCQQRLAHNLSMVGSRFASSTLGLLSIPHHNFTWLLLNGTDSGFEVFSGSHKLITKTLLNTASRDIDIDVDIETLDDEFVINNPEFVGVPIDYNGRVYFFYREFATEHINSGRIFYSRVSRVCKNDSGAGVGNDYDNRFVTFRKARLECSINGEFHYNEIQDIYQSTRDRNIVIAVFYSSQLGPGSSAVCAYRLDEIEQVFLNEPFRGPRDKDPANLWMEVETDPIERTAACPSNPPNLDNLLKLGQLLNPTIENRLGYKMANSLKSNPLLLCDGERFTQVVVDEEVFNLTDVMFIGTENGTVLKAYLNEDGSEATIVEEISLNTDGVKTPVLTMLKSADSDQAVFVGTNNGVYKIPFHHCQDYETSQQCLDARDPYCKWNTSSCVHSVTGSQNLVNGSGMTGPPVPISVVTAPSPQAVHKNISNHPINIYLVAKAPQGTNLRLSTGIIPCECDDFNSSLNFMSFTSIGFGRENLLVNINISSSDLSGNCICSYQLTNDCDMETAGNFTLIEDSTSNVMNVTREDEEELSQFDCEVAAHLYLIRTWARKLAEDCLLSDVQQLVTNCILQN